MTSFKNFINSIQSEHNDGRSFEQFCKWFLVNDPYWKTQVDQIWMWNDWPERWGPDCGIDLIFKHRNGEYWAIQSKCYNKKYSVSKKDMDTFLSESNRRIIQHRLLLATTNLIGNNAKRACSGQEKSVTLFMLKDFESSQINYPDKISDLYSAKVQEKPIPDPHQTKAINDVITGFEEQRRGQLIMACGTGKTFTTLWIKEHLNAQSTLILLPSLSLLSQTLKEWTFASSEEFSVLCICSDKSVGQKSTEDMLVSDAPFSVTSNISEISDFLLNFGPKVIFCTYQSSNLVAEVQSDIQIPIFDLVVADEAHRCAGSSDATFSLVLKENAIRSDKYLFTTATPKIYSAKLMETAEKHGVEVYGMDNQLVFGPVLHRLSFGEAIERNLLNDYQVVVVGVNQPMIKDWIDEQELISIGTDNYTDSKSLASKIGLLKAIYEYDLKRVISFHNKVKSARNFASDISNVINFIEPLNKPKGSLWADHVSGTMNATERSIKIDKLKNLEHTDVGLLSNARCLSEGVDVPSLDGIAFIDPRNSQVDIVQSLGRAIRKVRGDSIQKKGTIVLPVFIEDGGDKNSEIETSIFAPVWSVIKALRSHDDLLSTNLNLCRTRLAKKTMSSQSNLDKKIIFDLPKNLDPEFANALHTVLIESTTESWFFMFGLLENYVEREDNCRVLEHHIENDYSLGRWVKYQRTLDRKDLLSIERKSLLDELGFLWRPREQTWSTGFSLLEKFVEIEGHANVPSYVTVDGFPLGAWVQSQRSARRDKYLTSERESLLRELGFNWKIAINSNKQKLLGDYQIKERKTGPSFKGSLNPHSPSNLPF